MRLFDVATVIENGSHWPSEGDSRDCGLFIAGGEVCSPPVEGTGGTVTLNVVAGLGDGATYRFLPFSLEAAFERPVKCMQDDDPEWLAAQLKEATERAVLLSLIHPPYADAEVGFFSAGLQYGNGTQTLPERFVGLHQMWEDRLIPQEGKYPIAFVRPEDIAVLLDSHLIRYRAKDDELFTVWDEPVILLPSGQSEGDLFLTGSITVYLSPVEKLQGNEVLGNKVEYRALREAAVDTAPCAIARLTSF